MWEKYYCDATKEIVIIAIWFMTTQMYNMAIIL